MAFCFVLASLACEVANMEPKLHSVQPRQVSCFGYEQVVLSGSELPAAGTNVSVGGIPALIDHSTSSRELRVTLQGCPKPGPVEITLTTPNAVATLPAGSEAGLIYKPPVDPVIFRKMLSLGASFSFGIQSLSATAGYQLDAAGKFQFLGGMLMSPGASVARQAGAAFPQALSLREGFPGWLEAKHVAIANFIEPEVPNGSGPLGERFTHPWTGQSIWKPGGEIFNPAEDFPKIDDLEELDRIFKSKLGVDTFGFLGGKIGVLRLSPETLVRNFAIPSGQLLATLHGAASGLSLLGWLSIAPQVSALNPGENPNASTILGVEVSKSPVRQATELDPSLIISADLFGNDVLSNHPRDDVLKAHLLLLLLDLATSEWIQDPTHPSQALGIPYLDLSNQPIRHDDASIHWSPYKGDLNAVRDPTLRLALEALLAHYRTNIPGFSEHFAKREAWSIGWETDKHRVVDFSRLQIGQFRLAGVEQDDKNRDGWVDADELLADEQQADRTRLRRIFLNDPDPYDNPEAVIVPELWNVRVFPSGDGSSEDQKKATLYNGYLKEIAAAINDAAGREVILVTPMVERLQHWIQEDPDCGGSPQFTDFNGDGRADVFFRHFGGFFSLDGHHPSNTGYAFIANAIIETLNDHFYNGSPVVPLVNLREVWQQDYLAAQRFTDPRLHEWAEEHYTAPCE